MMNFEAKALSRIWDEVDSLTNITDYISTKCLENDFDEIDKQIDNLVEQIYTILNHIRFLLGIYLENY